MNPSPLESIPDDESLEDRLARTWARRARQASRAPEHQPVLDPESLDAILKRTWARRAEQARSASTQSPMHPAPLERHQGEAHRPPGQNGQSEDKESANLLSDEMSGPSVLSVSSALPTRTGHGPDQESMADLDKIQARLSADITRAAEDRMLSTQTGHGQDVEATADLTDESAAHPSPTPNGPTRFTEGLQNEKSKAAPTTLSDEIKEFIVKGLACYDTPSQVAEAVNLMFGVTVSRQRVYRYDPDNPRPPAQRWRDLHAATRQVLLREHAEIGVAHRAVRLRRLDRLASRCERNNVTTALKCLEMAAKECGGMYEKRRPIVLQVPVPPA
jgi:hypothetical protein